MTEEKEMFGYEEDELVTLEFDDGTEEECGIIGVFELEDKEYIALNPLGTSDAYIYGYKEYDEDFEMTDLTDEELEKASKEFEKLIDSALVE